MVAKTYQKFDTIGDPFKESGREYIYINKDGTKKKVRWYSDSEYNRLYPDEQIKPRKLRPYREVLGFYDGSITIFKGDTEPLEEWFKESAATYHRLWGWTFASNIPLPQIPAGVEPVKLYWKDIADVEADELKPEGIIKSVVDSLIYTASASEYQGSVGDRISFTAKVAKVIPIEGYYGLSHFHLFVDDNGNEYTWTTSAKNLPEGAVYEVTGTIKELKMYKNTKQNIMTRCKVEEVC